MSQYSTRSGRYASQQPRELAAFIRLLNEYNVRSYLEIGARQGDTFHKIMSSLPKGSRGLAVDLPDGLWSQQESKSNLETCVDELSKDYNVDCIFGSSHEISIDDHFDAILIDADHRYDAVKKDWEIYKGKGNIIAFHDIDAVGLSLREHKIGVPQLWDEIKDDYQHVELIMPDDGRVMGIGVLFT